MNIKVINISKTSSYSTKSFKKNDKLYLFCGRPSKLSNPFRIWADGNRDEVIEKFKNNFDPKELITYLRKVKPKTLILGAIVNPCFAISIL